MKTSEQTNELDAALSLFLGEMPVIKKDVNVTMNGVSKSGKEFKVDYDYAPLDSIQEVANKILSKHGLNVTQDLCYDLVGSNVIHVIRTRVAHRSGQYKMSSWPFDLSGCTKEQDRGSKITYNRRYAFVAALNIALSDEDNDAVGVEVRKEKKQVKQNDGVYVFKAGKAKGTKITDVSDDQILGYYNWIQKQPDVKGYLLEDFEAMKKVIDEKGIVPF